MIINAYYVNNYCRPLETDEADLEDRFNWI